MGWSPFGPRLEPPAKVADTVVQRLLLQWGDSRPRRIDPLRLRRAVEIIATFAQGRGVPSGAAELASLFEQIDT